MINPFYLIASVLVLIWFISFIVFNVGGAIHFLFLAAVIAVVIQFLKDSETEEERSSIKENQNNN